MEQGPFGSTEGAEKAAEPTKDKGFAGLGFADSDSETSSIGDRTERDVKALIAGGADCRRKPRAGVPSEGEPALQCKRRLPPQKLASKACTRCCCTSEERTSSGVAMAMKGSHGMISSLGRGKSFRPGPQVISVASFSSVMQVES